MECLRGLRNTLATQICPQSLGFRVDAYRFTVDKFKKNAAVGTFGMWSVGVGS